MDNEVYSFALKNALDEIQNICPDIKNSLIFNEDGEVIAGDDNTSENVVTNIIDSFNGILEKADTIGGVEAIILEGTKGKVDISCTNNLYLLTVTSRKANMNYVNSVTRVLIPTIIKLLDKIHPAPLKNETFEEPVETVEERVETLVEEETETEDPDEALDTETVPPEPDVHQLIIENLGGLLVPSDTVRLDNAILLQWKEFRDGQKIEQVEVETFGGKTTQCKVKSLKDSKYEGKGIIRMPEKIQDQLEVKKGELVRVKPVVD